MPCKLSEKKSVGGALDVWAKYMLVTSCLYSSWLMQTMLEVHLGSVEYMVKRHPDPLMSLIISVVQHS